MVREEDGFSFLPSVETEGTYEQTPPLPPLSQGETTLMTYFIPIIIVNGDGVVQTITGKGINGKGEVQFGLGHERGQVIPSEACGGWGREE